MVAILADGLVVRCASLGPTVAAPSRRRTRFCPDTVDVFAWPMDQYDLTTRSDIPCSRQSAIYVNSGLRGVLVWGNWHPSNVVIRHILTTYRPARSCCGTSTT